MCQFGFSATRRLRQQFPGEMVHDECLNEPQET